MKVTALVLIMASVVVLQVPPMRIPHEQIEGIYVKYQINNSTNLQTTTLMLSKPTNNVNYKAMTGLANWRWQISLIINFSLQISNPSTSSVDVQISFQNASSVSLFHFTFLVLHSQLLDAIPSLWIQTTGILQTSGVSLPYTKPNYDALTLSNLNLLPFFSMVNMRDNTNSAMDGDLDNAKASYVNNTHYKVTFGLDSCTTDNKVGFSVILFDKEQAISQKCQIVVVNEIDIANTPRNFPLQGNTTTTSKNLFFAIVGFGLPNCAGYLQWGFNQENQSTLSAFKDQGNGCSNSFDATLISFNKVICHNAYQYVDPTDILCKCIDPLHYEAAFPGCICQVPLVYNPIKKMCQSCPLYYAQNVSSFRCQLCPSRCQNCSITAQSSKCSLCKKGFSLTSAKTCCKPILGCTYLSCYHNSQSICLQCNSTAHFQVRDFKCVCMQGYQQKNQADSCDAVCGDGIKVQGQECDDGNTENGDGCSQYCHLQISFKCQVNQKSRSECYFTGQIKLNYDTAKKSTTQNVVTLQFSIQPNLLWLNSAEIKNFSISPLKFQNYEIKRKENLILITGPYNETMENEDFQVLFELINDHLIQNRISLSMNFTVFGKELPVTYIEPRLTGQPLQIITYLAYAILGNLLILLVLSILTHRMIGPQAIISAQASYLCQVMIFQIPVANAFRSLKYMNGFIDAHIIQEKSTIFKSFVYIGFESHYCINNTLIGFIAISISCIIISVFKIMRFCLNKKLQSILHKQRYNTFDLENALINLKEQRVKYYHILFRVLQPCCLSFMLIYVFSVNLNIVGRPQVKTQMGYMHLLNLFLCTFGYFAILFMVWLQLVAQRAIYLKTPKVNIKHFPVFLFCKLYFVIIVFGVHLDFPISAKYLAAAMELAYLIYIIVRRPYENHFHNIGLFVNQLPIILILSFCFYADFNSQVQEEWTILFQFVYIGLLLLLIVYSYARIVLHWCSDLKYKLINKAIKNQDEEQSDVGQGEKSKKDAENKGNPYLFQNIMYEQRVKQYQEINKVRRKQGFTEIALPKRPQQKLRGQLRKATEADKAQEKRLKKKLTRKDPK